MDTPAIRRIYTARERLNNFASFGVAAILFVIIARYVNPVNFDFFTPNHTDVYHYFIYSKTEIHWSFLSEPRPLSILYLYIIGFTESFRVFILLLCIPSFAFVILSFRVFSKLTNLRSKLWLEITFYCFVFSSVYFVQVMQLDFGGMLAGCFAVISIWFFIRALDAERATLFLFLSWIATVISTEFKPNFPVLILLIQFVYVLKYKSLGPTLTLAINAVSISGIYMFDKFNESPFLAVDENSPYFVAFKPIENLKLVSYYSLRALSPLLILLFVLLTLNLIRIGKHKSVLFFVTVITSTSVPISLLINRPWQMYSWYSLIPIGLYLVFALDVSVKNLGNRTMSRTKFVPISYTLVSLFILFTQHIDNTAERAWFHYVQDYNQTLNTSLLDIVRPSSQKILLSGLTGPYHQLKNTEFSKRIYPNLGNFDVLLRRAEEPWNEMSTRQTNGVYFEKVRFLEYSRIYVFTSKGTIAGILKPEEIMGVSTEQAKSILFCSMNEFDFKLRVDQPVTEIQTTCTQSF